MPSLLSISPELEPVQAHLAAGMALVETRMQQQLTSDLPPVQRLCRHVERYHGKMIRPALAMLSALASAPPDEATTLKPEPHDNVVVISTVCEMVHLATLVHDDVLDDADTRRRTQTVNSLRGNEAAVILGDYLFSAAFGLCSTLGDQRTSQRIAEVGMVLCAGELLQLDHREDFSLDEPTYFEIVKRKTASLIAAACELGSRQGSRAGGASTEASVLLERFGTSLGIAFQIQDDLLDLTGDQQVVGKSLGKDLEKGKLTLPIIHHLASAGGEKRGRTLELLHNNTMDATERSNLLRGWMAETDSINHARRVAESLVADARQALEPIPDSPAKRVLALMADAVVNRNW
jgi:octaprenyl-diphosphate synthase